MLVAVCHRDGRLAKGNQPFVVVAWPSGLGRWV